MKKMDGPKHMVDPSHMRMLQKHNMYVPTLNNWMWKRVRMSEGGADKIGHK